MQLAGLVPLLVQRGWEVSVLSMLQPGPLANPLRAAGVPVIHLGLAKRGLSLSGIAGFCRTFVTLSKELRRIRPDVVHSHMMPANLLTRLVRLFVRVPVLICTAHSMIEPPVWRNLIYRLTDRLCDLTTNVCRAGVEQSMKDGRVPTGRCIHIPNGVDTIRFSRDDIVRRRLRGELGVADRFTWLAVGRFTWEKDWHTLLQAIAQAEEGSLLLAVGDGKLGAESRNLADTMGLQNRVTFLGQRTDVDDLMNASDGLVMSSLVEGLPMVLLEAASCELPIVATNVGGVSEIVTHEVSGYLVKPGCASELASNMSKLQNSSIEERRAMGEEGRRRVLADYDVRIVAEKWDSLYRELLNQKNFANQAGGSSYVG